MFQNETIKPFTTPAHCIPDSIEFSRLRGHNRPERQLGRGHRSHIHIQPEIHEANFGHEWQACGPLSPRLRN